jgi:diguanylate cyclase (GGDEF)-like protein
MKRGVWSLRKMLVLPSAMLVIAVAGVIGWLSYQAAREAVDTVAERLLQETKARIGQAVERHVMGSRAVLEAAFPDGMPMPASIDAELGALRRRFWIATSLHTDPNDYVYYGSATGQFFGLKRLSEAQAELRQKLAAGEPRRILRIDGIGGQEQFVQTEARLYEPRERPWYRAGQDSASPRSHTWTAVYIDFATQELVATRARQVLSSTGAVQGVVATDVSLRALNDFVAALHISPNGFAFIVEPEGDLIATSRGANVSRRADGSVTRLAALASDQPLVRVAFAEVQRWLRAGGGDAQASRRIVGEGSKPIYLAYSHLRDGAGLDWLVVVGVPARDFQAGIADSLQRNIWLGLGALLLAIGIGTVFYARLARDLRTLTAAAQRIGDGELDAPVTVTARSDEIGDLARGFASMQSRLRSDALTGLANRETVMRRIDQLIERHRNGLDTHSVGVLFVDLDGFKRVNDELGHAAGNRALVDVAARLNQCVRDGDLVARYAGDEFVVMLPSLPDHAAAELVRAKVEATLRGATVAAIGGDKDSRTVRFAGSVGLAVFPGDGEDAAALIKHADEEMYRRKAARRASGESQH